MNLRFSGTNFAEPFTESSLSLGLGPIAGGRVAHPKNGVPRPSSGRVAHPRLGHPVQALGLWQQLQIA